VFLNIYQSEGTHASGLCQSMLWRANVAQWWTTFVLRFSHKRSQRKIDSTPGLQFTMGVSEHHINHMLALA